MKHEEPWSIEISHSHLRQNWYLNEIQLTSPLILVENEQLKCFPFLLLLENINRNIWDKTDTAFIFFSKLNHNSFLVLLFSCAMVATSLCSYPHLQLSHFPANNLPLTISIPSKSLSSSCIHYCVASFFFPGPLFLFLCGRATPHGASALGFWPALALRVSLWAPGLCRTASSKPEWTACFSSGGGSPQGAELISLPSLHLSSQCVSLTHIHPMRRARSLFTDSDAHKPAYCVCLSGQYFGCLKAKYVLFVIC